MFAKVCKHKLEWQYARRDDPPEFVIKALKELNESCIKGQNIDLSLLKIEQDLIPLVKLKCKKCIIQYKFRKAKDKIITEKCYSVKRNAC